MPRFTSLDSLAARLESIHNQDPYIAPSWSWASRYPEKFDFECAISYGIEALQGNEGKNNVTDFFSVFRSAPCHLQSEVTFVDYSAEVEEHNPYGRVQNAHLILHGRLVRLPSDITFIPSDAPKSQRAGFLADNMGTIIFDWSVFERTVVKKTSDLQLLLTASCCQATSNQPLKWWANPEEDHTSTFKEVAPPGIELTPSDGCCDTSKGKNGWGIVLHPAQIPGAYVRVGMFMVFGGSWGLNIFQDVIERDIKLI